MEQRKYNSEHLTNWGRLKIKECDGILW